MRLPFWSPHDAWLIALVLPLAACSRGAPSVVLATTTSVVNSGLLDHLLAGYDKHRVHVVQAGSGRALEMLADGNADVAISHAPAREAEALQAHPSWWYRKMLYNDFLIVGPPEDPARLDGVIDPAAAMRRIAESGQRFLSRGDQSGTHEREEQLWMEAGLRPPRDRLILAGAGMGQTLRVASATGAYTLTDRGTFVALANSLRLRALVSGDRRLLNTYAVLADPSNEAGIEFARWLAEGNGMRLLREVLARERLRGFAAWPEGTPGNDPAAVPY